jgi:hypothetical protein
VVHTHLDLDVPVEVTSFEQALPLADWARAMPARTLLVMLIDADGFAFDVLVYDKGDRRPLDALKIVLSADVPDVHSILLASSRGDRSPLRERQQDIANWSAMAAMCARKGVNLRDWFIVGGDLMFVPAELSTVGQGW